MDSRGPDPEAPPLSPPSDGPDGAAGSDGTVWYAGTLPVDDDLDRGVAWTDGAEGPGTAGSGDDLEFSGGRFGEEGTRDRGEVAANGRLGEVGHPAGEVLESGVERPAGERRTVVAGRRWWRTATVTGPWRRWTAIAAAALAAAGAIVALRAGAPAPLREEPAAAGTPAPVIIYGRARMQPPPFDRLPGRTPIPLPSPVGRPADAVRGTLPATGAVPDETSALAAVRLVLGRYCRYPRAYQVELDPTGGWREVRASVLRRWYGDSARLTSLQLRWTGRSYAWQGWPTELARCA